MVKKKTTEKYYFEIFSIHIESHINRYVYLTKSGQMSHIPIACPILSKNALGTIKCPVLKTKLYNNF